MPSNIGYAANNAISPLAPLEFDRASVGPEDIRIDIAFCGICHSDVHQARDEFGGALATSYPCMPGHEIVGTVSEIGGSVTEYAVGDRVGVGCMVYWGSDDDRGMQDEQYSPNGFTATYGAPDPATGEVTFGGYSDQIVVNKHFVLTLPDSLPFEEAAPLLCAGVTTWSPLRKWNVGTGTKIGVAGIGGLGHMAVQLAVALGAEVIALTTTPEKKDAILALGATEVVDMSDSDAVSTHAATLDMILSTIPTAFDLNPYLGLLAHDGTFVSVGMLEPLSDGQLDYATVAMQRLHLSGSLIGSIAETQEVLDFVAENSIVTKIEVVSVDQLNDVFDRIVAKEARFRYVLDNSTLRAH